VSLKIEDLIQENNQLYKRISELKAKLKGREDEIKRLRERYNVEEVVKLRREIRALKTENNKLKISIERKKKINKKLKEQYSIEEIKKFRLKNLSLEKKLSKLTDKIRKLTNEIKYLKRYRKEKLSYESFANQIDLIELYKDNFAQSIITHVLSKSIINEIPMSLTMIYHDIKKDFKFTYSKKELNILLDKMYKNLKIFKIPGNTDKIYWRLIINELNE